MDFDTFIEEANALIEDERFDEARAFAAKHAKVADEDVAGGSFRAPVVFACDAPNLQTEHEAQLAIGGMTSLSRSYRNKQYSASLRDNPVQIRILEEGDSWHQYPFLLDDLVDNVARKYPVYSLGYPGDTVDDMVRVGEYAAAINAHDPDVFMISAGGNDLLGGGRFSRILNNYSAGATPAKLINNVAFQSALTAVLDGYRKIIKTALHEKPSLQIFVHGYAYAIPREDGRSLGQSLHERGISLKLGRKIVALILDRFHTALAQIAANSGGRVTHFDLRKTVGDEGQWFDELHPTNAGFKRAAAPILAKLSQMQPRVQTLAQSAPAEALIANPFRGHVVRSLYAELSTRAAMNDTSRTASQIGHRQCESDCAQTQAELDDLIARFDDPEPAERIRARCDYSHMPADASLESIIGTADFDPYFVLPKGASVGRSVARIAVRTAVGGTNKATGFMVGPNLLMTNNHVLSQRGDAQRAHATFGYFENMDGTLNTPTHFRLRGDIFVTSVENDYTIVSVEPMSSEHVPLDQFGHIELLPRSGKALKAENVNIIQHPGGNFKRVALRKNLVVGRARQYLYYTADTLKGSSGAPVFNPEWQLVALHHAGVPDVTAPGTYRANRGIRISTIMADLTERRNAGDPDAERVDQILHQLRRARHQPPILAPDPLSITTENFAPN